MQGMWVWFLVGDLRFHMLMPKKSKYKTEKTMRKTKIKKNIETKLKKKKTEHHKISKEETNNCNKSKTQTMNKKEKHNKE